jgi:hypothetical protein
MLGKLLNFIPRRAKSKYADDKAVDDFTRVYNQVITDPDNAGEHMERLARMVGADGAEPDAGPPPPGLIDKLRKE